MMTGVTLPSLSPTYYGGGIPLRRQGVQGHYPFTPTAESAYPEPPAPRDQYASLVQPPQPPQSQQQGSYASSERPDYYSHAQHQLQPSGGPAPYPFDNYRPQPLQVAPYGFPAGYAADYRDPGPSQQSAQSQHQPAAPRQRTSIACKYCRKRKIRCSGYQNTPEGKCANCKKTGNECIFQPVSTSSAAQAFVPLSAIPGGVPPGTPLFGAFGQPLPTTTAGVTAPAPPPALPGVSLPPPAAPLPPPVVNRGAAPHAPAYAPPPAVQDYAMASPTGSAYYPYADDRVQAGMRRQRPADDEPAVRLPPPQPYADEDHHRRRSPASLQGSTPPTSANYTPPNGFGTPPPGATSYPHYPAQGGEQNGGPAAIDRRESPATVANIMNLRNLVDRAGGDIDQTMLGRLNNRRP